MKYDGMTNVHFGFGRTSILRRFNVYATWKQMIASISYHSGETWVRIHFTYSIQKKLCVYREGPRNT